MKKMSQNAMKMLVVANDNRNRRVSSVLIMDYFSMKNIKGNFAVVSRSDSTLMAFPSLLSAFKFVEALFPAEKHFNTREFFDNFRIVEFTDDDNNIKVHSIIANIVDYFDTIIQIADGHINREVIKDPDFSTYYDQFKDTFLADANPTCA